WFTQATDFPRVLGGAAANPTRPQKQLRSRWSATSLLSLAEAGERSGIPDCDSAPAELDDAGLAPKHKVLADNFARNPEHEGEVALREVQRRAVGALTTAR